MKRKYLIISLFALLFNSLHILDITAQQPVKSGPYKDIILTRQQRIDVREIDEIHRENVQAVRSDKSLSRKERELQLNKIRLKTQESIKSVLDPDQFAQWLSNRSGGGKVQGRKELLQTVKNHNKAVLVLREQMRDPFIQLAPDGYYYLSCTRGLVNFPDQLPATQSWRRKNLVDWEDLGVIWEAKNGVFGQELIAAAEKRDITPAIWAPEIHFVNGRWVIVHTTNMRMANLMLTKGSELKGPYEEPMALDFGFHRDPALFIDDDETPWLITNCTEIRKLKKDFSGFDGFHKLLNPQDRYLGHEGAYIVKFENKYVLFGTAWSTDNMRRGTYNLYYCTADSVTGPYGPRKFAGRFLGHGTPFQDKEGRWWCTAFTNADNPPLEPEDAKNKDLSGSAYTINRQGLTLVPIEIKMVNGDVEVTAKDENHRYPGEEELQKF